MNTGNGRKMLNIFTLKRHFIVISSQSHVHCEDFLILIVRKAKLNISFPPWQGNKRVLSFLKDWSMCISDCSD